MNHDEMIAVLSKKLSPHRFCHTLGVAHMAAGLAMRWGESDLEPFLTAGILHDCAKYMSYEENLHFAQKHGIDTTNATGDKGFSLHAVVGAYLAKTEYGVDNENILSAIRYHTVGRHNMSFLEKCIYIADFLEPSRSQITSPSLTELRKMAYMDMDQTLYLIMDNLLRYLRENHRPIDETIFELLLEYKTKLHNNSGNN